MASNQAILSSAVIVPDTEDGSLEPPLSAKRRQSSASPDSSKRRRLSSPPIQSQQPTVSSDVTAASAKRQDYGKAEERKRGKRLFGALLGALNQNSSSAAQRRRGDIERKQQEKIKQQEEEYDEQQKIEREAATKARRAEQEVFMKQAMVTRQANTSALARFLYTKSEPKLYYKPWDLLPDQKSKISKQISEAQESDDKRLNEEGENVVEDREQAEVENDTDPSSGPVETSKSTGLELATDETKDEALNNDNAMEPPEHTISTKLYPPKRRQSDASREGAEEGGDDFIEGDEDDVIY